MHDYPIQGKKGGDNEAHTPVETKNNLLSKSYAKVLLALGEGEFAGVPTARDIYLDGTPLESPTGLQNFGGVKWEFRSGRTDQTYIQGMPEVSNEFAVNFPLTETAPYTRLISNPDIDAARITISWPAIMEQKDNGDIVGYNIEYAIDVATNGGAFTEVGRYDTNKGKTNVEYNRTHRVDLPRSGTSWTVRVRRITPKSSSSKIQDVMNIKSFAEVIDAKFRYPNTALLYIEFDAELFGGTSIPRISVKTKGRYVQVPNNYNPVTRTYSGVWNGGFQWAWTDNPAWVFYDIVTQNRFGLGSRITPAMVDKWTLYQVSQYCDVLVPNGSGGTEPRYTCNLYIQSRREAWQVLRDIAAIFNGMLHWNGTQMVATADMPVDVTSVRTYNRSQVVEGKFSYGTPSEKTMYTTALVSYDNPENHYETAVEPVTDLGLIQRWKTWSQAELSAIGCTSRGEAQRKGKYTMLTNSFNRVVSFKLGMEGYLPTPGEVIGVADQVLAGANFSGRIHAATLNSVTTDRDLSVVAGDILYVNKADGKTGEGRTVQSVSGRTITVTANFSAIPEVELGWYVEKTNLKSQLYRVTKVTWDEDNSEFEVLAAQYEDSKYAAIDNGARLEARPITVIPAGGQDAPTGLTISAFSYIEQTMAITTMSVKWNPIDGAMNYEAQWRKDGGDWINAGLTTATGFDVKGIYSGDYQARVRAINAIGTKSVWTTTANTTLTGKVGAPPALASFTTASEVFAIRLNWTFAAGSDDGNYIQIQEASDISGTGATELTFVSYPAKTYLKSGMAAGVQRFFRARLIDRSGISGPWTSWTMGISSTSASEILDYLTGQITETELGEELLTEIQKIDVIETGLTNVQTNVNWIESQLGGIEQDLQQNVTALDGAVSNLDNLVDSLNDDVQELYDTVAGLQTELDDIIDALEYDPTKTYIQGDTVRSGQRLYQATQAVPINTPPPNVTYWIDIGQVVEGYGALSAQVSSNTATITQQGNSITAQAQRLDGVEARVGNAETSIAGNATAISNLQTTVTQQGNSITSQGSAITALQSDVADNTADIASNSSAISSLQTTTTSQGNTITSQGQSITALQTSVGNLQTENAAQGSAITALQTTVTSQGNSITANSNSITSLQSDVHFRELEELYVGDETDAQIDDVRQIATGAATATSALTTTVSQQGDTLLAQGNSITQLTANLATTDGNVAAQGTSISNLQTTVTQQGNTLTSQGSSITSLQNSVGDVSNRVSDLEPTVSGHSSSISSLNSTVTQQGNTITSQGSSITSLQNSVSTLQTDVTGLRTDTNANSSAITGLQSTVTTQGNTITSQGNSITSLSNRVTTTETDISGIKTVNDGQATAISGLNTQVSSIDGKVTSISSAITGLQASYRSPDATGDLADALKLWDNTASISSEQTARAGADEVIAQDIITVKASVANNAALIQQETVARANADSATAYQITTIQASVDNNTASIQTNATAIANTNGSLSAMYSIKLGVNSNGQYYGAGMGIGIENTPAGMQSQVLFVADRFAILNSINGAATSPFVVQSGTTYINSAFIQDGTITNAKIGNVIQSTNYVAGSTGWSINKDGSININGTVAGQGRMYIDGQVIAIYDAAGVERVRLGRLT